MKKATVFHRETEERGPPKEKTRRAVYPARARGSPKVTRLNWVSGGPTRRDRVWVRLKYPDRDRTWTWDWHMTPEIGWGGENHRPILY